MTWESLLAGFLTSFFVGFAIAMLGDWLSIRRTGRTMRRFWPVVLLWPGLVFLWALEFRQRRRTREFWRNLP